MRLSTPGISTLNVEVLDITPFSLWLFYKDKEYQLPFDKSPFFKDANVNQVFHVIEESENHLYWPDLDVDLSIDIIENPDEYPLVGGYKV